MTTQAQSNVKGTSVIVHGASGRMGARLCALALDDPSIELVAALARAGSRALGAPAVPGKPADCPLKIAVSAPGPRADVVVDFSSDSGVPGALAVALHARAAILVATTALSDSTLTALRDAAKKIPVIVAPNTSLGVAVLADAAARIARALGPGYRPSIVEAHHSKKADAPSGTALRLAHALDSAGSPIGPDQILSIRSGDVVGEHTVRFAGPGEYLELTHRATTRDLFALGALRAAKWLHGRAPGWWTIEDVVGLSRS
jgi:4-hydroxy-tetrahydrodipicolinate reductase